MQKQVVEHHRNQGGMTRVEKFKHYFQAFSGREIEGQELSSLCSDFSQLVVAKVIDAPEIPGAKEAVFALEKWLLRGKNKQNRIKLFLITNI